MVKVRKEPIDFGVHLLHLARQTREIREANQGVCHAVYFGDSDSGTHKDGIVGLVMGEVNRRRARHIAAVSKGSWSTALELEIIANHPGKQFYELVPYTSLRPVDARRGYSIEYLAKSEDAPMRIKIGFDRKLVLTSDEIKALVKDTIRSDPFLRNELKERDISRRGKVVDVTNPHDFLGTDEPLYDFSTQLLSQYNAVVVPFGTGTTFYAVQCAINKLPEGYRPALIAVTNQGHPITRLKGSRTTLQENDAGKLVTPYLGDVVDYIERGWDRKTNFIFTPTAKDIQAAHGRANMMNDKHKPKNERCYDLEYKSVWQKEGWLSSWKHVGYKCERSEDPIEARLCSTGSVALTALDQEYMVDGKEKGFSGFLLPNVHASLYDPNIRKLQIPFGTRMLLFLTGEAKADSPSLLAKELYDSTQERVA